MDEDSTSTLDKDWLSAEELEERSRYNIRQAQIRKTTTPLPLPVPEPAQIEASQSLLEVPPRTNTDIIEKQIVPASAPTPLLSPNKSTMKQPSTPISLSPNPSVCRSTRVTRGSYQTVKYSDEDVSGAQGSTEFVGESYLASVSPSNPPSSTTAKLAYTAELETDFDTG